MTQTPTHTKPGFEPTTCYLCGRHASFQGVGSTSKGDRDLHLLCDHCVPLARQIRATMKFDVYEENAVQDTIEGVGPLVMRFGPDITEWTAEQRTEFATQIILGFGTSIRRQVREQVVPF